MTAAPVDEDAARQVGIRTIFDGEVLRHDVAAGVTWLRAGHHEVLCRHLAKFAPGSRGAPGDSRERSATALSILHDHLADRPNRLDVTVRALLALGDEVRSLHAACLVFAVVAVTHSAAEASN